MTRTRFGLFYTLRHLLANYSLARVLLNKALAEKNLSGFTIDIGGGRDPEYLALMHREGKVTVEAVDLALSGINLEHDPLPYPEGSVGTALLCNILEHIYNHQQLLKETLRVLIPGGRAIGFVPFWVGYHPDPHDYFRYTGEALRRMLADAGFTNIQIDTVGGGPFVANFNTLMLSLPRVVRPILYFPYSVLDALFLQLRPKARERHPLGYLFSANRPHA